jgi:hypothetical protein
MAEISIGISNFNVPKVQSVVQGPNAYQHFADETGCGPGKELNDRYTGVGFEWTPIRNLHPVDKELADRGYIGAAHQSWRSSTIMGDILPRFRDPKGNWYGKKHSFLGNIVSIGIATAVPPLMGSIEQLAELPTPDEQKRALIAYPNQQEPPGNRPGMKVDYVALAAQGLFGQIRYQPSAELAYRWDVLSDDPQKTAHGLLRVQGDYGFDGVTVDSKHLLEERHGKQRVEPGDKGYRFTKPEEIVDAMAEQNGIDEVHVNLTDESPEVIQLAITGGLAETSHGRILLGALKSKRPILIVSEVAARDLSRAGYNYIDGNQKLVDAISELLPAAA